MRGGINEMSTIGVLSDAPNHKQPCSPLPHRGGTRWLERAFPPFRAISRSHSYRQRHQSLDLLRLGPAELHLSEWAASRAKRPESDDYRNGTDRDKNNVPLRFTRRESIERTNPSNL